MKQTSTGIISHGAYVPRLRLERAALASAHAWFDPALAGLGKGTRAIGNWDEDTITMAVEAVRDCLGRAVLPEPGSLILASTTLPFLDRQNAVIVKEALNLSDNTATLDVAGSRRAGTSALLTGLQNAMTSKQSVLCVAAEKLNTKPASQAEFIVGDAAAAVNVGRGKVIAEFIGSHSISVDFVDHFRSQQSGFDYDWEARWVRDEGYSKIVVDAVQTALTKYELSADAITHFILPASNTRIPQQVARKIGLAGTSVYDTLQKEVGQAGVAQPLLMLSHCLESAQPGDRIMVVGFGQGCDVLLFQVTKTIEQVRPLLGARAAIAAGKETDNYMRYLVINDLLDVEKGMRAEVDQKTALTALYRDRKAAFGLVGGCCRETGTKQFPRTRISVNQENPTIDTQDDYRFADIPARILTHTADRLAFSIDPPSYYGTIEFEGGGRMVAEFTDVEPSDIAVGATMRMMFRVKEVDRQRGFIHYFWKAVPDRN